jgi:hAT family C-terminal dimerisation region
MEEYRERGNPIATSAAEHQDVAMDAWQMMIATYDAELADGKETFTRNTQQSVKEEYATYVMGALSGDSVFDTLGFWKVRSFCKFIIMFILINCRQTYEHTFPTIFRIAMDYLPIQASAVPCERVFSSSAETDTKKRNRILPELMEALQVLKYSLKKSRLNFTAHLDLPEKSDAAGSTNLLKDMLKLTPNGLKGFLDAAAFDD